MVTLADSLVSSASRRLPLRMRPDLSVRYHRYLGKPYWVVKEPIGLKYFRFQEEEFSILQMLDGTTSFQEIKEQFEREFAPQKISLNDLQHFIGMLHRSGLLITDAEGQGTQLKKRRDEHIRREWLSKLSNVLALRFKGIDPDRLLNWLAPYTNWYFTKWAGLGVLFLGLSALLLVLVNFHTFRSRLPAFHEFFGAQNWLWLGITLAITKVLHEFGHGLSCKRFGGECHEMGVMFLVLTPCLYCNVSDSWLLPNKWHRATIGAAGMYVEVTLASIATFLWWFSEQSSTINQIALSTMFICSVSTVMFNGNPLLRFDGYYILSDIAEIPNLRQKSSKILQRYMSQYCLGIEQQEDPFLPQRNRVFFAAYTVAAVIYRWVVVFSILMFLNQVLKPYGLQVIGRTIALAGLIGLVVQPAWQFGKFLHVPGRMHQVKRNRVIVTLTIIAVLLGLFCYFPLPYSVKCAVQVHPRKADTIFASVAGELVKVSVNQSDTVKKGDELARLENPDLRMQLEEIQSRLRRLQEQRDALSREFQRTGNKAIGGQLESIHQMILGQEKELRLKQAEAERLIVRAPRNGAVIPKPRKKPRPEIEGQLDTWSGSLLDPENIGATLSDSDELFFVGDPKMLEAYLFVDQTDIPFVQSGQTVRLMLEAYPGTVFETVIENEDMISRKPMEAVPDSLSFQAGGTVATRTDKAGLHHPLSQTYQVIVPLANEEGLFYLGMRGRAKIAASPQSLGRRLYRYLTKTFHFEL
jgi:putative peptide zinc metalloprotease protein